MSDGTVTCWGDDSLGQTGTVGTPCGARGCTRVPTPVPRLTGVTQVAVGSTHACALRLDGTVLCWGGNADGELAAPTVEHCGPQPCATVPTLVPGITDAVQVSAGGNQTCVRRAGGGVRCWGTYPLEDGVLTGVAEVSVGWDHACARMADGTARCWGGDTFGQLGAANTDMCTHDGLTAPCAPAPQQVVRLSDITGIAAGVQVTCATMADDSVRCWGSNHGGEIGVSLPYCSPAGPLYSCTFSPHAVAGASNVTAVSAGTDDVCAVRRDGALLCWGMDQDSQLGFPVSMPCDASPMGCTMTPTRVPGVDAVAGVTAGSLFTCAWRADGAAWCWGNNVHGELGDGTLTSRGMPTRVLF